MLKYMLFIHRFYPVKNKKNFKIETGNDMIHK